MNLNSAAGMFCWPLRAVLTSSIPLVMLPLPSAVKEPMRAKKLPVTASEPLIEKAYWPFRLELEKLPVGSGGVGVEPLPPQAAAKTAAQRVRARHRRFIVHRPSGRLGHLQAALCLREGQPDRVANRELIERRLLARQPEPSEREKFDSCRPNSSGRRSAHWRLA